MAGTLFRTCTFDIKLFKNMRCLLPDIFLKHTTSTMAKTENAFKMLRGHGGRDESKEKKKKYSILTHASPLWRPQHGF